MLAKTFYKLSCIVDSSIEAWDASKIVSSKMNKHGLGTNTTPEKFTYNHVWGSIHFIYSRFGQLWKLDGNLFNHHFLQAINSLTFHYAILMNSAAVHYHTNWGVNFSKIVNHIESMARLMNATFFGWKQHQRGGLLPQMVIMGVIMGFLKKLSHGSALISRMLN
jgi:hypothetical protein